MFSSLRQGLTARRLAGAAFVRCLSNVLVTRQIPKPAMEILRQEQSLNLNVWDSEEQIPRDEFLKRVKNIDGLYCLITEKVDGELLDAAGPQLKIVSTMSVGFDHVNTSEIKKRGIKLGYTPGVLTDATANLTVALLLATARRLIEAAAEVKNGGWGTWKPLWMCGPSLRGSTVGIVGYGRIGVAVAKRLAPFGVAKFLYTDIAENPQGAAETNAQFVDRDTLLKESDFVLGCTALTAETKELFNKDVFSKMKKTAIFVNSSRGGVVQQEDLYEALTSGEIAMAGLDVTVPEPLPPSHPLVSLKNCVILPHIGSAETPTREAMGTLAARNLVAGLKGEEMPAQAQL